MSNYQNAFIKIKKILNENPRGLTIQELSQEIEINRNSIAKYLDIMLISGNVEMRPVGRAKMYYHTDRIPISAMLNISSEYIIIFNKKLEIIQVNDAFLDFYNIKRETIIGNKKLKNLSKNLMKLYKIIPKLTNDKNEKYISRELRVQINKTEYYLKVKFIPTTLEDGGKGITLLMENITERKQIDEALHESESRFRELADLLPVSIYELDLESNITYVNRSGLELFGYSQEDFDKGLNTVTMMIPKDFERAQKIKQRMISGEKIAGEEYVAIKKDGITFDIYVLSTPIINGEKKVGLRGIAIDITERKKAEKNIRNLAKFPSENPNPVLRIMRDGIIRYANNSAKFWLDKWGSEIGKSMPEQWTKQINDVLKSGKNKVVESKYKKRIFSFVLAPIITSNYVNIYGRDVTEQKQFEKALRDSENRLRKLIELLPTCIFETDLEGIITYMNPVGLELFGYTQENLKKGLKSSQLVIFVNRKKLLKNKQKILQKENVLGVKYIALRKDGTKFDAYVDSIPIIHNNQVVGTRGIAINISK